MPDLDVIQEIEKQIDEPLKPCGLETVMSGNSRCCYVLDSGRQVIALNLQNCKQSNLLLLKKLAKLTHLNLSLNQITQLSPLEELDKLTHLNLHKNNIVDLSPLKELSNLTLLNLQDNQVSDLKPLKELRNLSWLNLQANQIDDIKHLAELSKLTTLNLSSNHIKDLTPLRQLKQLITLNLSSNQIIGLESLRELDDLLELDLRFNQISKLEPLKNLNKIIQLYLSSNAIVGIEPLKNLKDLTHLYLSSNQIADIAPLENLRALTELDLRANKIADINALKNLNQLGWLYLESNQISDITPLESLTHLTQLNLRNNQIINIEALKKFTQLNQLYLSNNKIQLLPKWIVDFNLKIKWNNGGDGISVMANPLKYPPPDIIKQGNLAIKAYFEALAQQQQRSLNEMKICFVGDSETGKTSLKKILAGEEFDAREPPTEGITIADWRYQHITAHCWDFSGDAKISATHSLFFSQQCLYLLVLDNRSERRVEHWLKKIEYLAGNVPILIVLNKCEQENYHDVDRKDLIGSYNSLQENSFFTISCAEGLGLDALKQGIAATFNQLPLLKKLCPEHWIQVKNTISQQLKERHYISSQFYMEICQKHGIKETLHQEQLAQFLHNLGVFVCFKKFDLPETYILESNWIAKSLYKIICSAQLEENKGLLFIKSLGLVLKPGSVGDYSYSVDNYRDLINLMRYLELCFLMDKSTLLVPQLLNTEEPDYEFSQTDSLKFRIHYEYLDEAIISRFIVRLHEDIVDKKYWRNGLLLKNGTLDANALVKVNYAMNLITIHLNGKGSRKYFSIIRKALLYIESTL